MEGPVKTGKTRIGRGRSASHAAKKDAGTLPEWIESVLDAARHGTYFDALGLASGSTVSQVRDAWKSLVAKLDAIRPLAAASPEIASAIVEIETVGEDALVVLTDPDLRLAYRRGLGIGG